MSTYLYDEAFVDKLRKWTADTEVTITSPEDTRRLFEVIADKNNDCPIPLPLIALRRRGGYQVLNRGRNVLSSDGMRLVANDEVGAHLNAIPISIPYQLDVYARHYKEADEYMRNIIFNVINYPRLDVSIPYEGVDYVHSSNIRMSLEVEDNSDIPERLVVGQFTRLSLQIDIDDAYLWDVHVKKTKTISYVDTDIGDKTQHSKEDLDFEDTKIQIGDNKDA